MDSIRTILSPLFIISYVFGIKLVEFPADEPRLWLGILYILLLWSVYYILLVHVIIQYAYGGPIIFYVCFGLNNFTVILSIIFGLYYEKKFRNCLRKLTIVDNTLEKLGITTDYQKLYTKILLGAFGWCLFVIIRMCVFGIIYKNCHGLMESLYITFMVDYCSYLNLIEDLIIVSILGYIELKFDQINEYLQKLKRYDKHEITRAQNDFVLLRRKTVYPKSTNSEYITWIVIHLHLELRRISRELDSIFGLQLTVRMGTYFAFITLDFSEIFNAIFDNNYHPRIMVLFTFIANVLIVYMFRLFLINYMYEKVSMKANETGNLINSISYCSHDVVVRENILQLTLQMSQAPIRFYGFGFFQFGLKFFHGYCSSVATVVVILVQSHTNINNEGASVSIRT